jgi:hypothetical protein
MADGIDDIRRDIAILPNQEKAIITKDALRSLDPEDRKSIASEFTVSPESRQERQTTNRLMLGFLVFIFTLTAAVKMVELPHDSRSARRSRERLEH